jgi:hypothetical protein
MVSDLVFYELLLVGLLWLYVMLSWVWPDDRAAPGLTTPTLAKPPRKRSRDPQPFPGLTRKPHCTACEQAAQDPAALPPPLPPPPITSSRGRPHQVDTSQHFCPNPDCDYRGWVGWGNLSSNGHPSSGPWRQLYCSQCGHCSADSEIAIDRADDRFYTTGPNLLLLRGAHHVRTG